MNEGNPMAEPKQCPRCGTPLKNDALAGLCPACLLHEAAAGETATAGPSASFQPPTPQELAPLFPQFEITELIGKGGMGAVYKARQKQLDRVVALKILPPAIGNDPAFAERFAREAKALARLNHPAIVTIHDFGRAGDLFYFSMEFVDGVTLRQLLNNGRISPREALAIVPQICDALQYAHDQGIVHRDIKPENILLDRRGRVKVADFGLAKLMEPETFGAASSGGPGGAAAGEQVLTEAGKVMGTPSYMAPEQVEHPTKVDHRADIYSLGVVFYQMLTGELPGKQIQPPSSKVQIDVRLDEVVLRALAKDPGRRYSQVSVFKTRVEELSGTAHAENKLEANERIPALVAALTTIAFFGLGAIGTALISMAHVGPRWNTVILAILLAGIPFFAIAAARWIRRSRGAGDAGKQGLRKWLKAWACAGLIIWLPVAGFGSFFITALLGESGGWNPGFTEAVMIFLIWTGSIALPICSFVLFRSFKSSAPRPTRLRTVLDYIALLWFVAGTVGTLVWMTATRWQYPGPLVPGCLALMLALGFGIRHFGRGIRAVTILFLMGYVAAWSFLGLQIQRKVETSRISGQKPVGGNDGASVSRPGLFFRIFGALSGSLDKRPDAHAPERLRLLRTDRVITAALSDLQTPWAWHELQGRADSRKMTSADARALIVGLTDIIRDRYPDGYSSQPLFSINDTLVALQKQKLLSEPEMLDFVVAYHGRPTISELPRIRVGKPTQDVHIEKQSPWHRELLGFVLLSEFRSVAIDGQPAVLRLRNPVSWKTDTIFGELDVSALVPGRHLVTCELVTSVVAKDELAGLSEQALPEDWPAGKRRWTRTAQAELHVYPANAPIVRLTDQAELAPVPGQTLSVSSVIIRRARDRGEAVIVMRASDNLKVPLSFDVTLVLAGKSYHCGTFWRETPRPGKPFSYSGNELRCEIELPAADVTEAAIVLTPNPAAIEHRPGVDVIWGKELRFTGVPVSRQDQRVTSQTKQELKPIPAAAKELLHQLKRPPAANRETDEAAWQNEVQARHREMVTLLTGTKAEPLMKEQQEVARQLAEATTDPKKEELKRLIIQKGEEIEQLILGSPTDNTAAGRPESE